MAKSTSKPFELIAGHPALDFINTLDDRFSESAPPASEAPVTGRPASGPRERLNTYSDLVRFVHQSGLLTDRQARKLKRAEFPLEASALALQQAIALREALATMSYAALDHVTPPEITLTELEAFFKQSAAHRRLQPTDRNSSTQPELLEWTWKGLGREVDAPVWLLSQAAAELLTSPLAPHIRSCASDTCRWLFLDTSKNHSRRWCDMRICGNRMKARRHQSRLSASLAVVEANIGA